MTTIFKVLGQGEALEVQSKQSESGVTTKCSILLKEMGGKYADEFVATMFGNMANCRFYEGDVVVASLRFQTHEHNGTEFQDVIVNDIHKINN